MRINTNINSMRTQEYMRQNQAKMSNAMDRLSSGKRINNASDDAAGLAIATRMRARESGLGVAADNTQNGMALVRTADSAMNSVSNILLRMRDIANQSANGTNTDKNQIALQKEFGELQKQIDYIAGNTQFNDKNLLDGSNSTINIQTLDSSDETKQISIQLNNVSAKSLGIAELSIGSSRVSVDTKAKVETAMTALASTTTSNHQEKVAAARENFDKVKDTLSSADVQKITKAFEDYSTATDKTAAAAKIGSEFATIKDNIKTTSISQKDLDDATAAIPATADADDTNHAAKFSAAMEAFDKVKSFLKEEDLTTLTDKITAYNEAKATTGTGAKTLDVAKGEAAAALQTAFKNVLDKAYIPVATGNEDKELASNPLAAVKAIDAALKSIADNRATLGATLNRLDFNVNNLKSQQSAMASSASQIEDADMAKEMSEMTKFKILNEAGISMLSQANQTPQMVSKLLQ
ncbi:flagellin N-terminal helical domain-containing protein [Bacillus wiedmannii]